MNHYVVILNKFVGLGNPSCNFWFIGFAEAGKWPSDAVDK